MDKNIKFIAGLPRSGSTLLTNILAQNDKFHTTPTNDLSSLILNVKSTWTELEGFKAQGLEKLIPNITATMRYMLYGFYEYPLSKNKIIFDKSRAWLNNIELLEDLLQEKVQLIVTVRDVKDICASFEKLQRKNILYRNKVYSNDIAALNTRTRTEDLLSITGAIGQSISCLRDALQKKLNDRLIIVPFTSLTYKPKETLEQLHDKLGLERFEYDFDNVENLMLEDDLGAYGLKGLHNVRKKVFPINSNAKEILGEDLCKKIDHDCGDINSLT